MKFARIQAEKAEDPSSSVAAMCSLLGVSRAGYYAWSQRGESARTRRNRELTVHISALHQESRLRDDATLLMLNFGGEP